MDVCLVSGRHLTVFNSQSLLQVGGRWSEYKQTLDMPFQVIVIFFYLLINLFLMTGCIDWDIIQWNETPGHGTSEKSAYNDARSPHPTHLHTL